MRGRLIIVLALLGAMLASSPDGQAARTVADSAGRQVEVPDRIERVFAAGPPASVLLYVLAPDRLVGWPRAPHPEDLRYIAPEYRDLPGLGSLLVRSVGYRDYPLIQGLSFVFAVLVVIVNLLADLSYMLVDRRVLKA